MGITYLSLIMIRSKSVPWWKFLKKCLFARRFWRTTSYSCSWQSFSSASLSFIKRHQTRWSPNWFVFSISISCKHTRDMAGQSANTKQPKKRTQEEHEKFSVSVNWLSNFFNHDNCDYLDQRVSIDAQSDGDCILVKLQNNCQASLHLIHDSLHFSWFSSFLTLIFLHSS